MQSDRISFSPLKRSNSCIACMTVWISIESKKNIDSTKFKLLRKSIFRSQDKYLRCKNFWCPLLYLDSAGFLVWRLACSSCRNVGLGAQLPGDKYFALFWHLWQTGTINFWSGFLIFKISLILYLSVYQFIENMCMNTEKRLGFMNLFPIQGEKKFLAVWQGTKWSE